MKFIIILLRTKSSNIALCARSKKPYAINCRFSCIGDWLRIKKIVEYTIVTCKKHKPKWIAWCAQKDSEGATKSQQ